MANTTVPHDRHHLPQPQPQPQQEQAAEQPPPVAVRPQAKKQARKRTHASRPYQERLLNMAEARREIVTALKIHRANMNKHQPHTYQHHADTLPSLRQSPLQLQQLRHQEQQQRQEVQAVFQDRRRAVEEEEGALLSAPASYASYSGHQLSNPSAHWISASAAATPAGSCCYSSPILPYDLTPPLEAPMPSLPTAMGGLEQLARSLPAQPLGLNLSFVQGFGGSEDGARDCEGLFGVPVVQFTSSPAASSYSAYSSPVTELASGTYGSPVLSSTAEKYSPSVDAPAPLIAPPVLDDGDTPQSASEAHGVEWFDEATAADVAAASAWWSKALHESMDSGGEVVGGGSAVGCTPEDVAATSSAGLPPADQWRWLCDDGVGEQGAVTGTDDKPLDLIEMLADGDFYACCYDEGDRRRSDGGDGITLPW
jgi:hypothetical protein